jgi:hypothetical protein
MCSAVRENGEQGAVFVPASSVPPRGVSRGQSQSLASLGTVLNRELAVCVSAALPAGGLAWGAPSLLKSNGRGSAGFLAPSPPTFLNPKSLAPIDPAPATAQPPLAPLAHSIYTSVGAAVAGGAMCSRGGPPVSGFPRGGGGLPTAETWRGGWGDCRWCGCLSPSARPGLGGFVVDAPPCAAPHTAHCWPCRG